MPGQISQLSALPSKILQRPDDVRENSVEQQEGRPPLPGWKPAKLQPKVGERIILAEHVRAAQ